MTSSSALEVTSVPAVGWSAWFANVCSFLMRAALKSIPDQLVFAFCTLEKGNKRTPPPHVVSPFTSPSPLLYIICSPPDCAPEGVVQGVSVGVAPVLQVYAEAVMATVRQQVELLVAQPVLSSRFTEAATVLQPAAVKAHRSVTPPLKHRPASTWEPRT